MSCFTNMGCCQSLCLTDAQLEEKKIQEEINKMLEKDKKILESEIKVLILGTGESGKSTFIKQMRIIHGEGFSHKDVMKFRELIFQNIFMAMQALITALDTLDISYNSPEMEQLGQLVLYIDFERVVALEEPFVSAIKTLWRDAGIQNVYRRRREIQLTDSAKYYLDDIDRVANPEYVPTQLDILKARSPTTNIAEYKFKAGSTRLRMIDVGGQRSERKKWFHFFDDVASVIFIASLSEYDQVLYESHNENRMRESLNVFGLIVNSSWFSKSSIILFLNKKDILEEKIIDSHLADYFPDYYGPSRDATFASIHIRSMFLDKSENQDIFTHFTCATDTDNIKIVFVIVKEKIMQNYIDQIPLL